MELFLNPSTGLAADSVLSLFLFIALAAILFIRAERLTNFGRGSPREHSSIIISKSIHWLRRRSSLKVYLFLALTAILFTRRNGLNNFGRELPKKHSCDIISKSVHRFSKKMLFKVFFYL